MGNMTALKEQLLASPTGPLWKRVGIYPHHGIDVFLPALRSEKSCGIGEFFDLLPLIDWCHRLKMDVVQLLPLNNADHDPSPYNPMSSCAIHFILLSLHALPDIDAFPSLKKNLNTLSELNKTSRIAYADVIVHKTSWLQAYYDAVGKKIRESTEFQDFARENVYWLEPYALFRAIKDHLSNAPWLSWPDDLKTPTPDTYRQLLTTNASKVAFYSTMQFLCYLQLKEVKAYAMNKKVLLKGDIPILVGCESAEVWHHQTFFNTHMAAGAPPDMYYSEGQYWGFPLFHWDEMRKDHFTWWKQRLKYASYFFDLFRIDHIIGFFRIWAIPLHAPAKEGHYIPQSEKKWEQQGRELLHMILSNSEGMMPIAEDLGTIPDILPICLKEMCICGTKILRWERYWKLEEQPFIPYSQYPRISLTSVSTHDSPTLTQWWRDFPEEAKSFCLFKQWDYDPELSFEKRQEILSDSHHTPSLFHINLLQEYLALFPELVWPDPDQERINIPGTFQPSNWTYRYRPSVEEITSHQGLLQEMQKILFSPASPL
jgi:4-alpha-glucanotransferase